MPGGPGLHAVVGMCGWLARECGGGGQSGGAWGWCRVCFAGACVRLRRRACAISRRPGGLKEELAVLCGHGEDSADEHAYLVYLAVSGGQRVPEGWAKAHTA